MVRGGGLPRCQVVRCVHVRDSPLPPGVGRRPPARVSRLVDRQARRWARPCASVRNVRACWAWQRRFPTLLRPAARPPPERNTPPSQSAADLLSLALLLHFISQRPFRNGTDWPPESVRSSIRN